MNDRRWQWLCVVGTAFFSGQRQTNYNKATTKGGVSWLVDGVLSKETIVK